MTPLVAAVPAFVGALVLTGLARRTALARSLLDVPNERSSHTSPTPKGGGVAIVVVVLAGVAILWLTGSLGRGESLAILGGGALVAVVGWLDDRRDLSASARLAAHVGAAAWALWWLGGMPYLTTGHDAHSLGMFGTVLGGFAIVWAINVTNFMDGIDGLAAGEVVTVTLTAALLLAGVSAPLASAAALTGGAALGFLPWNWRPARIFMGDTGSGFLGFVLAVLAIASERAGALPALVWIMLYGVFATDATVTLLRRAWRGDRWYSAHRSHAYQRAVQAGWSHARVTTTLLLVNVGLGLLAWRATVRPELLGASLAAAFGVTALAYGLVERHRPMAPRSPSL